MPLDIVIARYEEDVDWVVRDLVPMCRPDRVFIYNKSPVHIEIQNCIVVPLPNVGREAHTYLHHMISTYDANEPHTTTIFLPGSCRTIPYKWETACRVVREVLESSSSFFPFNGPFEDQETFQLSTHTTTNKQNAQKNPSNVLEPSPVRPYGRWCRTVLGRPPAPGCTIYWGIFAVSQRDIQKNSLEMYRRLITFVDHHPNAEAAHYFERAWPIIFDRAWPIIFDRAWPIIFDQSNT